MASTPQQLQGITHHALDMILRMKTELPLHRVAAAALTVAFQIAKTDHLSRGEIVSDAAIKDEIKRLFNDFTLITDPQLATQAAQQRRP